LNKPSMLFITPPFAMALPKSSSTTHGLTVNRSHGAGPRNRRPSSRKEISMRRIGLMRPVKLSKL
ncbi:hypothetical protein DXG01_001128, partial [Tephrocybe rancida]